MVGSFCCIIPQHVIEWRARLSAACCGGGLGEKNGGQIYVSLGCGWAPVSAMKGSAASCNPARLA